MIGLYGADLFMPIFYDTHSHLDYPDYAQDLDAVLERPYAATCSMRWAQIRFPFRSPGGTFDTSPAF